MNTTTTESTTTTRPRLARVIPLVTGLVVVGIVAAVILWRTDGQDVAPPYDDPQAGGLITLCSADGKTVSRGKVDDRPFADVVLGETGLPSGTEPEGAVATLFAYQPREGIAAGEFSGTPLTAAVALVDPDQPAVPVTEETWSVADFVTAYPATDDGFVQLRIYLGTPEVGTLTEDTYDTADLRVDGDSWELVRGGSASCADAAGSAGLP